MKMRHKAATSSKHSVAPSGGGRFSIELGYWLRPYSLAFLLAAVSLVLWVAPWGSHVRTGFTVKQPITVLGAAILVVWYGTIVLGGWIGYSLGKSRRSIKFIDVVGDPWFYWVFSAVAFIGIAYTYIDVWRQNPSFLTAAIVHHTFNAVRYAVPYHASVQTLRYASIVSGAIAMYELVVKHRFHALHILNILLLLASAAIASRASLAIAVLLFLGIVVQRNPRTRISLAAVLAIVAVGFLATVPLNYVRNAGYYRVNYGVTNPLVMNVYEVVAYVGGPFQAAIGVANNVGKHDAAHDRPAALAKYLIPTYFHPDLSVVTADEESYRSYVDIQSKLTTNSAFASMYGSLGWVAFPFIFVLAFLAAALAGHASNYRSLFFLTAYVIAYAFSELWRVYLFNYGILHFLVLGLLATPVAARAVERLRAELGASRRAAAAG